jgi:hypothetical protein
MYPENVAAIYGAELGVDLHARLRENATQAGLGEKYRVLPCGAEPESLIPAPAKAVRKGSLGNDVFAEVICIHVLCSVPKQRGRRSRGYTSA